MSEEVRKRLLPKLRFPEFSDADAWSGPKLADITTRITQKVGEKRLTTVSITASLGFVSQEEKFGRDISGKQYKNYIELRNGDFSYNKGNSKTFPQGAIYQLREFEHVAAPNAFISFSFLKGHVAKFYKGYFNNNFHGAQLLRFITSGARSDGLLNISPDDFFSIILPTPDEPEQKKIADCLSSLDDLIEAEYEKLETLKDHKKGLMQKLFPTEGTTTPEFRFPEFRDATEWEQKSLNQIGDIITGSTPSTKQPSFYGGDRLFVSPKDIGGDRYISKTNTTLTVEGFSKTRHIIAESILFVCIGSTIGKVAQNKYECATNQQINSLVPHNEYNNSFVYFLLEFHSNSISKIAGRHAVPIVNKTTFGSQIVQVPLMPEQERIGECLSSVDAFVTAQNDKIIALKDHKKGLMEGLFPSAEEAGA